MIENNTIICGVEEPLDSSIELIALDEASSQLILANLANVKVNRYIFLSQGDLQPRKAALNLFLGELLKQLEIDAFWLSSWSAPSGENSRREQLLQARLATMLSNRKSEGWEIVTRGDLTVASKRVSSTDFAGAADFEPAGFQGGGWKRLAIVVGEGCDMSDYFSEPPHHVISKFAQSGVFAPNNIFLTWLVERKLSLIYKPHELEGCTRLAWIGAHAAPLDLIAGRLNLEVDRELDVGKLWKIHC